MYVLSREALRQEARRLSAINQRLLHEIIAKIDAETAAKAEKERGKNAHQSQGVFRLSASQPF